VHKVLRRKLNDLCEKLFYLLGVGHHLWVKTILTNCATCLCASLSLSLSECPTAMDGMERFACPTPDLQGRYRCIDDHVLCDGFIDCPEGEDEDRRSCMFYKTVSNSK